MSLGKLVLRRVAPFSDSLVMSFLYLMSKGIENVDQDSDKIIVYGYDLEQTLSDGFKHASELIGDNRLPLTGNDRMNKEYQKLLNIIGASSTKNDSEVFIAASENVNNLIELNKQNSKGPLISLIKSEYYEESRTPMFLDNYERILLPSSLYVLMALAGYTSFKIGRSVYINSNFSVVVSIEDIFTKDPNIYIALKNFKANVKNGKPRFPNAITSNWAFSLWLAVNFNINHTIKVYLVDEGNRITVKNNFLTDLRRLNKGLEETIGTLDQNKRDRINWLLSYTLSKNPLKDEINYTKMLFEAINGIDVKDNLIITSSRNYSLLLNNKGGKPDNDFNRYKNMWIITNYILNRNKSS